MSRIPYDLTAIRGFAFDVDGVLSPLTIPVFPDGRPARMTNMRDGLAIKRACDLGFPVVVISGARATGIENRLEAIGIPEVHMSIHDKLSVLREWMTRHGLQPEEVAYTGDDLPDIAPMSICGLRIAPADAAPEVMEIANYISPVSGGHGVARDLIEQVLRAKRLWGTENTVSL